MKRHKFSFAEIAAIFRSQSLDQRRVVVRTLGNTRFVLSLTNRTEHRKLSSLNFRFKRNLVKVCHALESVKTIVNLRMCETLDAFSAKLLHIKRSHHRTKDHRSSHPALVEFVLARDIAP